jgi:hypothetical protein
MEILFMTSNISFGQPGLSSWGHIYTFVDCKAIHTLRPCIMRYLSLFMMMKASIYRSQSQDTGADTKIIE